MTLRHALSRLRSRPFDETHEILASRIEFDPRKAKSRRRLFPPAATFCAFLRQILSGNLSCSETVQRALAWLCRDEIAKASPNAAAYCKARARLDRKAIVRAWDCVVENLEARAAARAMRFSHADAFES